MEEVKSQIEVGWTYEPEEKSEENFWVTIKKFILRKKILEKKIDLLI